MIASVRAAPIGAGLSNSTGVAVLMSSSVYFTDRCKQYRDGEIGASHGKSPDFVGGECGPAAVAAIDAAVDDVVVSYRFEQVNLVLDALTHARRQ